MKKILVVISLIAGGALGYYGYQQYMCPITSLPEEEFSWEIEIDETFPLVKQNQFFRDSMGYYKFTLLGETRYVATWISEQSYGIELKDDWDWQWSQNDGVITGVAPDLNYLGVNIDLDRISIVKTESGLFVDDDKALNNFMSRMKMASVIRGGQLLDESDILEKAELSLENKLLLLFKNSNPAYIIHTVDITIAAGAMPGYIAGDENKVELEKENLPELIDVDDLDEKLKKEMLLLAI